MHALDLEAAHDRLGWRGGSLIQIGLKNSQISPDPPAPSDYSALAWGRLHAVCMTYAFSRRQPFRALRPFIDPILTAGKGSKRV